MTWLQPEYEANKVGTYIYMYNANCSQWKTVMVFIDYLATVTVFL